MLGVEELERLLVDLESHRVERKLALTDPEKIRQAICAFANDLPGTGLPGYLFVGVDDAGVPTGKPVTDQMLLTLADMRSDGNILPPPRLHVEKLELRGCPVAVVEVHPSDAPPVRFKGQGKVEIHSPGGLYGQVTAQNFRRVSDYRNPVLGEAMKVLGYVERFGVGIARAEAALAANNNPPAEFIIERTHVLVTLGAVA
ncbi:hypothetical protein F0U62_02870 [Cystobacter fuscus]|uniref:ATP-binding protein n=1 Tax=Cystobacter fuscus TaxID=43 RepID=UPI002B2C79A1|nr:hypothetical protein F0U62_02870 [Cystobacter fuscus]